MAKTIDPHSFHVSDSLPITEQCALDLAYEFHQNHKPGSYAVCWNCQSRAAQFASQHSIDTVIDTVLQFRESR